MLAMGGVGTTSAATPQSSPSAHSGSEQVPPELMEMLGKRDQYSMLVAAIERTGIDQGLAISPSFTLLAPTDSAFAALDIRLSELERYEVTKILRNHVIQRALSTRRLESLAEVTNTRGLSLRVGTAAETVGRASLVNPDMKIESGVVHGVDMVITAETKAARRTSLE